MPERLKIAVVGAGRWGPHLIRNFSTSGTSEVVGVADANPQRLKQISERYPGVHLEANADALLSSTSADAVVICSPTSTHFRIAEMALNQGKHVFVEKPLATTPEECDTLIRLAKAKERVLFVGHVFVYNAGIQAVNSILQSGDLGEIHYLQMTRTNLGPIREDVSALWDLAPHDLAILGYWFGEMPDRVSAVGGKFLSDRLDDAVFATYRFPKGRLANVHVSWLNPKKVREIVLVGNKKMLVWDDLDLNHPITIFDKRVAVDIAKDKVLDSFVHFRSSIHEGDTLIPRIALNEPLAAECEAFLQAIRDPKSSLSDGQSGADVVSALMATDESLRSNGKEIRINYQRAH